MHGDASTIRWIFIIIVLNRDKAKAEVISEKQKLSEKQKGKIRSHGKAIRWFTQMFWKLSVIHR